MQHAAMCCVPTSPVQGQVLALVIAGQSLVSAGQDATIRVWAFNQQAQIFMSQVGETPTSSHAPVHPVTILTFISHRHVKTLFQVIMWCGTDMT